MRILWTLLKVIVGLAIAIPVSFFVLALAAGVLGVLLGLVMVALKLASSEARRTACTDSCDTCSRPRRNHARQRLVSYRPATRTTTPPCAS
jgi:hypothetical protein